MLPQIYDHATNISNLDFTAKEEFPHGSPLGITLHYTADNSAETAVKVLMAEGLGYHIIIERDGSVWQMTSFNRTCWHAGKATWLGRSPNHHHIAIALVSWGLLSKDLKSYSNVAIASEEIVYRPDNINAQMHHWQSATAAQLASLQTLLTWLIKHGIDPSHICGHDEAAIPFGRKMDPGGVLPMTMSELRKSLKENNVA